MVTFCKNSANCFVFEVLTVNRFQNKICIASHHKENKILKVKKKWEHLQLTLDNSEEGQGDH